MHFFGSIVTVCTTLHGPGPPLVTPAPSITYMN